MSTNYSVSMGIERKQTTKEVPTSPRPVRLVSGGSNPAPALKFLADVKQVAGVAKHGLLLQMVKEYKKDGPNLPNLVTRVENLLAGHWDLLVAFNTFLPEGIQCTLPKGQQTPEDRSPTVSNLARALEFLDDVQKAAGDFKHRLLMLMLLKDREHGPNLRNLVTRVEKLLAGHRDLLVAFNTFLPEGCPQCTLPK